MRAIQSLDFMKETDLHYSDIITCSVEDAREIKETMIKAIEKIRGIVRDSKDETMFVYALDLFGMLNRED